MWSSTSPKSGTARTSTAWREHGAATALFFEVLVLPGSPSIASGRLSRESAPAGARPRGAEGERWFLPV